MLLQMVTICNKLRKELNTNEYKHQPAYSHGKTDY